MTQSDKKHRIIFIDLMRAFAVIQMVQGHTTDVLLSPDYRSTSDPFFYTWFFMRGMTAPIFMFTAGTVFTYLFRLVKKPFSENPRVVKGVKRFLLLVFLGYMLRYPTYTIVDFSSVTDFSWRIFFAVDVLHLIGFSILFLILLAYVSEKIKISDFFTFSLAAAVFYFGSLITYQIDWHNILPRFIAGYFYTGSGSLFPLFPWAGYVILGGVLGSYLAKHPLVFKTAKFSYKLAAIGAAFILISFGIELILSGLGDNVERASHSPVTVLFRTGFVLLLNSLVAVISLKVDRIPKIIILIGRNTLLIYVVHLVILYGSAWNFGINHQFGKSFNVPQTVLSALTMITLMTIMVIIVNKFKIRNKELVT